jgi:hypothetical protein
MPGRLALLSKLRTRLTYANVMATVAVFVALGGSSYAAIKVTGKDVKDASLTGKDVKNSSLTTSDVRNGSLLGADFKPGQLPAGPQGPKGDTGAPGAPGDPGAPGTAKAYARVNPGNPAAPLPSGGTLNNPPRSKGVLSIHKPDFSPEGTSTSDSRYCFDLTFVPELGVASPHPNNGAIVGVETPGDFSNGNIPECPSSHDDALVRTRAASDSSDVNDTIFAVIFE